MKRGHNQATKGGFLVINNISELSSETSEMVNSAFEPCERLMVVTVLCAEHRAWIIECYFCSSSFATVAEQFVEKFLDAPVSSKSSMRRINASINELKQHTTDGIAAAKPQMLQNVSRNIIKRCCAYV